MKKKLIIFMPSIEGGGVEKNLFLICNYLTKKYDKLSIITVSNRYKPFFSKKIKFIGPKNKLWHNTNRLIKYLICSFYLILEIFEKNNEKLIVSFQGNLFSILIGKILKVKILARANAAPSGWIFNSIKKKIFEVVYSYADIIVVNSLEFKKEFKKFFNLNSVCIYNPLDKKKIYRLSKQNNNYFKSDKNVLKIINIGRMVEQKNQILLLKALNVIKEKINFRVLIIGNGILKRNLVKFAKENNLNSKVKIINFQKNPYKYLSKSDVLIHTAKFEGLPNVLLEAQLLKKFIISSDCPTGPKEILCNGKAGFLFKNGDYKELSKKIVYFFKNQKILNKKVNYGYNKIYRFDYNLCLKRYYAEIKKIF